MCIERLLETVECLLTKYEKLTVHDDFFCTSAGCIKNKAGPIDTENFSSRIDKVPPLRVGPHVYGDRLSACRHDSFHGYNSSRLQGNPSCLFMFTQKTFFDFSMCVICFCATLPAS